MISSVRLLTQCAYGVVVCLISLVFGAMCGAWGLIGLVWAIVGVEVAIYSYQAYRHVKANPVAPVKNDGLSKVSKGLAGFSVAKELLGLPFLIILAGIILWFIPMPGFSFWSGLVAAVFIAWFFVRNRFPRPKLPSFTRHRVRFEENHWIWDLDVKGMDDTKVRIPAEMISRVELMDGSRTREFVKVEEAARLSGYMLQMGKELSQWNKGEIPFPRVFLAHTLTSYVSEEKNLLLAGEDLFWLVTISGEDADGIEV